MLYLNKLMEKKMLKRFLSIFLIFNAFQAYADVLPKDGLERKQLIAMGYDIDKEQAGDTITVATAGSTKIAFSKTADRLAVSRYFNREKKLNASEELELFKIINSFNTEYSYQFNLENDSLTATLYDYGNYDPKTFAKLVRMIDKVNVVFDTKPGFYKLVNK
jgi:hypothetical protein